MAIQCADVETLVPAHLDGELAEEDARALQAHLATCTACGALAREEARFHAELRQSLIPPPAPFELRARMVEELDREGWRARQRTRTRQGWTLPALASVAAAAALALFVVAGPRAQKDAPVAQEAVRQHMRRPPLEVQGTAVSPWVKRHLSPSVHVPRFSDRSTNLRGARLSHLRGRDAVQVFYDAVVEHRRYEVSAIILDASGLDMRAREHHVIGGRELWVGQSRGYNVVTHKDGNGIGYVFISEMDAESLLDFVVNSDLLLRASESQGWQP